MLVVNANVLICAANGIRRICVRYADFSRFTFVEIIDPLAA